MAYLLLIRIPGFRQFLEPVKIFYRRNRFRQREELLEGRLILLEALVQGLDERIGQLEVKK
jgi:hypothetical protein